MQPLEMNNSDVKKYRYYRYLYNIRSIDIKIDAFASIVCFFFNLWSIVYIAFPEE